MVLLASGPRPQRGFFDRPKGLWASLRRAVCICAPASLPPTRMTQRKRATLQFLLFTEACGLTPHKGD